MSLKILAVVIADDETRSRQRQFDRRQALRQRQPALAVGRSQRLQEGLLNQDIESARRKNLLLESDLLLQRNLLEQKIDLPRADLLDNQKSLNLRLLKDQSGR